MGGSGGIWPSFSPALRQAHHAKYVDRTLETGEWESLLSSTSASFARTGAVANPGRSSRCVAAPDNGLAAAGLFPANGPNGAAQESNLPSRGLHDRTGFEDRLGHWAHTAPCGDVIAGRQPA